MPNDPWPAAQPWDVQAESPSSGPPPLPSWASEERTREVEEPPRRPRPPHPGFWWAHLWCLGYLVATQITAALIGAAILIVLLARKGGDGLQALNNIETSPEYATAMAPAVAMAQIFGIIGAWMAMRLVIGRQWPRHVALRLPSIPHVILVLAGLPGMMAIAGVIDVATRNLFMQLFDKPSLFNLDEFFALFGRWHWTFAVLAIGLGPGLCEEMFCRGFLGRGLVGRYGVVGGVLLTSYFFAIIHLEPRQVLYAFPMGVLLHLAYLATRSLWIPILMHTVNNSLAVLAIQAQSASVDLEHGLDHTPWYGVMVILLGALALVFGVGIALYQSRARLEPRYEDSPGWTPAWPGVECPPSREDTDVVRPFPSAGAWAAALAGFVAFVGAFALAMRLS